MTRNANISPFRAIPRRWQELCLTLAAAGVGSWGTLYYYPGYAKKSL